MDSSVSSSATVSNEKLHHFMGKILSNFGGAASTVLAYIGDKLGLYVAMYDFGKPITAKELANITGTSERYIKVWLANQAAGGYLTYDPASQRYTLPIEHAQALVNENSPAYPDSKFYGFDNHSGSIEYARNKAKEEGLGEDRIKFEVGSSLNFPSSIEANSNISNDTNNNKSQKEVAEGYDLITFFDCLHDMEDPQGAVAHALETLKKPDGIVMIIEPFANDKLEDNLNPLGRMFYAASTMLCVPASLSHNGLALGAQAGEAAISLVVKNCGFKHFRRAIQTPFNIIYEAKP